ncbi:MAG: hypothetical protein AAGK79_16005 [Pseudomonadota bacterium]
MSKRIFGWVTVDGMAVTTHRDTYLLPSVTAVSVRRPFFAASLALGGALSVFGLGTADILQADELIALCVSVPVIVLLGARLGQLKLLSRDLKNTELADAVWGDYAELQKVRREIADARNALEVSP